MGVTKVGLDGDVALEFVPEIMNDVRKCVDTSIFVFVNDAKSSGDDRSTVISDEDFLNETRMSGHT